MSAPVVVHLEHVLCAEKGRVWTLEIAGEQVLLRDAAGELRNAFTPQDAAREWVMPEFVRGNPLTIPTGEGPAAFRCQQRGIAHLRAFMRAGASEASPNELRGAWIRAAGELTLGCVLAVAGIAGTVASYSTPTNGKATIYYGVVLFGLIEVGRGIFLLRECALRARERRRRSFEAFATAPPAIAGVPVEAEVVSAPAGTGKRSPVGLFIVVAGGFLTLLFVGAIAVTVVGSWLQPAPVSPNPAAPIGAAPTPPAEPTSGEIATTSPEGQADDALRSESPDAAPGPAIESDAPALNAALGVEVVAVEGDIEVVEPPASVLPGDLVSSSLVRIFAEGDAHVIAVELACDSTSPGTLKAGAPGLPGSIPAGERVASYLLHANTFGGQVADLEGAVIFSADILGVIISSDLLDASDEELGREGVRFPIGGRWRGWLDGDTADWVTISEDRRTVSFRSSTGRWVDQIRVVVRAP